MLPKETLREEIKNHLKEIPMEEFKAQGNKAAALFRTSPFWPRYSTIFIFLSMNSEIDTQSLLETALKEEKKIFAPRVQAEKLFFCRIFSPEGPWRKGPFGIREPLDQGIGAQASAEDFPALIITPGLAFDKDGNRLGKGKGYYDRFFGELDGRGKRYTAMGLCMDFQLIERVPIEGKDKKVDFILTQNELLRIKEDTRWEI
jgi:5-formyltetrahydrofolate cyclo-ligase